MLPVCNSYTFNLVLHIITILEPVTAPPIEVFIDPAEPAPQLDDIRTVFHPSSGRVSITESFESYGGKVRDTRAAATETEPWSPFQTRADFELAEFALDACLNARQANTLLKLVQNNEGPESIVTFKNDKDIRTAWENVSNLLTPVSTFPSVILCTHFIL